MTLVIPSQLPRYFKVFIFVCSYRYTRHYVCMHEGSTTKDTICSTCVIYSLKFVRSIWQTYPYIYQIEDCVLKERICIHRFSHFKFSFRCNEIILNLMIVYCNLVSNKCFIQCQTGQLSKIQEMPYKRHNCLTKECHFLKTSIQCKKTKIVIRHRFLDQAFQFQTSCGTMFFNYSVKKIIKNKPVCALYFKCPFQIS